MLQNDAGLGFWRPFGSDIAQREGLWRSKTPSGMGILQKPYQGLGGSPTVPSGMGVSRKGASPPHQGWGFSKLVVAAAVAVVAAAAAAATAAAV